MIQRYPYTTCDYFELDDYVFDGNLLCNDYDDTLNMFENELHRAINLDHVDHNPSRSKCDSETLYHKPTSSKLQPPNKLLDLFDLPDTANVYDSPTSFADNSNYSF